VRAIYNSAKVQIWIQEKSGERMYSRNVDIRRSIIQGDIPSPVCFLIALDKLLKDHGALNQGIQINEYLVLSHLAFADDAALGNANAEEASARLTHFDQKAKEEAGMEISIPKTKVQHIQRQPKVGQTTEADIDNLPPEKAFKHKCDKCDMTYPTAHGLAVHKGRWCKKRKTARKPSRKGTVADRIITREKIEKRQEALEKVKIGEKELDNVYSFIYLGSEHAADGDQQVTVKHRCDIAWGRFGEYKKVLLSTKLPVDLRVRLFVVLIVSTMLYGACGWFLTKKVKQTLNGHASRMLSAITRRTIHEEAKHPTFDIIDFLLNQRWNYLGHILRMDEDRALRKFLLHLQPDQAPFVPGSLLDDTNFSSLDEAIEAAQGRATWRKLRAERTNDSRW